MNHPQELRLFIDDKTIILTQNKIGTRFLRDVYKSDSYNIDTIIHPSGEFDFKSKDGKANINIISELKSIIEKTTDKEIIMLVRDPEKRLITGLVQDILDDFQKNYNSPFFIKTISSHISKDLLFKFIEAWNSIYRDGGYESEENWNLFCEYLTEDEIQKIMFYIYETYIKLWGDLNLWQRGHNNPYLFSFYEIFRKNNTIRVFDLDNDSKKLSKYLTELGYTVNYKHRSNNHFKKLLSHFFDSHISLFRKLSTIVVERDIYFYKYLTHFK